MYAILRSDNSIGAFECDDIQLEKVVHPDFKHLYIEIQGETNLKIGDIWNEDLKSWEIVDAHEPMPDINIVKREPTNAEVAQLISDLKADLIIAGVI